MSGSTFLRNRGGPPPPPRDDEPLLEGRQRSSSLGSSSSSSGSGAGTTIFMVVVGLVLAGLLALAIVTAVDHFSHQRVSPTAVLQVAGVNASTLNATAIHGTNVQVSETLSAGGNIVAGGNVTANGTVMAVQFMTLEVLAHNTSGPIPPTHARQTLQQGSAPLVSVDQIASMSLGPLPQSGVTSSGQSLLFQTSGACWKVRDLAADPYTSASDAAGQRVIQLGDPEVWGGSGTPGSGSQCPSPSSVNSLKIFPSGAAGTLILRVRSSSEPGYDFVTVYKNGAQLYQTSGPGTDHNTDAFKETTLTIDMTPTDVVLITYIPDSTWWGGYDIMYIRAEFAPSQSLTMTIPVASLADYVGKDIQICSQDSGNHLLSLDPPSSGVHLDAAGQWEVLRFQGTGSAACCVTLSITTADRVEIKSRDACTVFCDSLSQIHCVDPLRPYETSPIHGWWKGITKTNQETPFGFMDATTNPAVFRAHGGTVNNPTEQLTLVQTLIPHSPLTFVSNPSSDLSGDSIFAPRVVTFQPGFAQFVLYLGYDQSALPADDMFNGVFEKLSGVTSPPVPLVPASTGTLTDRSAEDPVQILRNYFDKLLFAYISTLSADDKWIGFLPAKALLEEIISTGKTHTAPILEARVTMPFNPEGLTEFRTEEYHHIAPPARVHVTGYTGGCTSLNSPPEGHLVAVAGTNNVPLPSPLFEDYGPNPAQRTVHHKVTVFLDSSGIAVLPNSQIADCPGSTPQISVSYGPITSETEYLETIGAINYWFYEAMKIGLHYRPAFRYNVFTLVFPSGVSYPSETWPEVQFFLGAGPDFELYTRIQKQMASRDTQSTSHFYTMPPAIAFRSQLAGDGTLDRRGDQGRIDLTGRFGIRGDLDALPLIETDNQDRATYAYSIVQKNYLEETAYLAWKLTGTSRTDDANLFAQIISTTGEGDEFDAVIVPFGQLPPADYSFLSYGAPLNYPGVYDSRYTTELLVPQYTTFFGRIKTSLTSGVGNVGYIRMADVLQIDPFYLAIDAAFCPTASCNTSSYRNNAEALVSMFAKIMQYLRVDLGCTHIILDSRANAGGTYQVPAKMAEFFGGDDRSVFGSREASRTDNGNGNQFPIEDFLFANNLVKTTSDLDRVSPALSELLYPGSVWQNGEFIFLTDTRAGSGGDVFPNMFLGNSMDGNLGGGVQTRMVGSVDGRLTGYAGGFNLPYSRDSPRLRDYNGVGITPFRVNCDQGMSRVRVDGTYLANRVPGLEIDYSEALGLAGGNPLWADWEELVYKDLGFVTNTRPVIPGWTGPQTPEAILVTNVISTTIGSNVVTVTMPLPHGFSTGDDVALGTSAIPVANVGGLSGRVLTGGHIITVTGANTFTFETSDEGTVYNGPEFVGSIYFGLGTGPDAPSTSFVSPVATSTVSGSGGTFYVMRRNAWRDAWLEQSILSVVANAKKKRRAADPRHNVTELKARIAQKDQHKKEEQKAHRAARLAQNLKNANKRYGRNVGCPAGVHLTSPRNMTSTVNVTHRVYSVEEDDDGHKNQEEARRVRQAVLSVIKQELADGGMCLDGEGRLMATPSCKANPRVVTIHSDIDNTHRTSGCPLKKKTAKWAVQKNAKHIGRAANMTAFELPEDATYESCMTACEQTTQVKTKQRRLCVLRCGAEFPTHMLNRPSEAARKRAEKKGSSKRC